MQACLEHALMLRPCSEKRVPPTKKYIPGTNTISTSQIGTSDLINIHLHKLLRIEPTTGKCNSQSYKRTERNAERCLAGRGMGVTENYRKRRVRRIWSQMNTTLFSHSARWRAAGLTAQHSLTQHRREMTAHETIAQPLVRTSPVR